MFYLDKDTVKPHICEGELDEELLENLTDWRGRYQELERKARDPRLKRFYEAGIASAETPISDVPMLSLDFETTGLDQARHGIVSVGCMPMTLARINNNQAKFWVAKPRRPLTDTSVVIHGITHSQIEKAPDFIDIVDELLEEMAGRVMVVHYRGIKHPFFHKTLKNRIGEGIEFPVIDTMELEARLHRFQSRSIWRRVRGVKPVSIRLADSRKRYNLPWYRPHDAVIDALSAAELLQAQIAHHYSPDTPIQDLWV